MTGPKLNEYPAARPGVKRPPVTAEHPRGARARARYIRISAYKVRQVLDLIRGQDVDRALETLKFCERDAALVVGKLLNSAVANAAKNHELHDAEELYVSACFADEGPTLKRWRPRARGRATRIRKRTCHITLIVSRLPEVELQKRRASDTAASAARRRRIAGQKAAAERARTRRRRADAGTPEAVEGADLEDDATVASDEEAVADETAVEDAGVEEAVVEGGEGVEGDDEMVSDETSAGQGPPPARGGRGPKDPGARREDTADADEDEN
jgi:large subunit ribosomal protein L22